MAILAVIYALIWYLNVLDAREEQRRERGHWRPAEHDIDLSEFKRKCQ